IGRRIGLRTWRRRATRPRGRWAPNVPRDIQRRKRWRAAVAPMSGESVGAIRERARAADPWHHATPAVRWGSIPDPGPYRVVFGRWENSGRSSGASSLLSLVQSLSVG